MKWYKDPWAVTPLVAGAVAVSAFLGAILVFSGWDNDASDQAVQSTIVTTTSIPPVTTTTTQSTTTTSTMSSTTTTLPTIELSTTVPNPVKEKQVSPATGPMTDFFGLRLPLDPRWQIVGELSNGFRTVVIDTARCDSMSYAATCPGFVVVNFRGEGEDYLPYENPAQEVETSDGAKCYWNLVSDNTYYGSPQGTELETFGSVKMRHSMHEQCNGTGHDVMHSWRSDSRGVVIYDLDPSSDTPVVGLEEILAGAAA